MPVEGGGANSSVGPKTRRAWQDLHECKSNNNSNLENLSKEEEGIVANDLTKMIFLNNTIFLCSQKNCQEQSW